MNRRSMFTFLPVSMASILFAGIAFTKESAPLQTGASTPNNFGSAAGEISRSLNLGTEQTPFLINNQDDLLEIIMRLGQVLDEGNAGNRPRSLFVPLWVPQFFGYGYLPLATGWNKVHGFIDRFEVYSGPFQTNTMWAVHKNYQALAKIKHMPNEERYEFKD